MFVYTGEQCRTIYNIYFFVPVHEDMTRMCRAINPDFICGGDLVEELLSAFVCLRQALSLW